MIWSLVISFRQKSSWKTFAEKHSLRYTPGKMMQSPDMDGTIEGYKFSFFTGEHATPDIRVTRKMTGIELTLNSTIPIDGCVASGGMIPVVKTLNYKAEIVPQHEGWNKTYTAQGTNKNALSAYLTDERLQVLTKLMQINNIWMIYLFRNDHGLLRIDTPNPLDNAGQLEKIYKIMLKAARVLELKAGEAAVLKAEEAKPVVRESVTVPVNEGVLETPSTLQLEEDDPS